jgi:hypothetical protein
MFGDPVEHRLGPGLSGLGSRDPSGDDELAVHPVRPAGIRMLGRAARGPGLHGRSCHHGRDGRHSGDPRRGGGGHNSQVHPLGALGGLTRGRCSGTMKCGTAEAPDAARRRAGVRGAVRAERADGRAAAQALGHCGAARRTGARLS